MSKYTMSVAEMIDENIPIFNNEFEDYVSTKIDTTFTVNKWTSIKDLFIARYFYCEIGSESLERFYNRLLSVFKLNIGNYIKKWQAYNTEIEVNFNNVIVSESGTETEEMPMTELADNETHLSNRQKITSKLRNANKPQIEIINDYIDKIRNIDIEFVNEFKKCFMLIY